MTTPIACNGFTNEVLDWKAWLDVVDCNTATPEQIEVLELSHPQAKSSDYYLVLAHQPAILRQRSDAYNAIMYAPGGLSRADRELGALTVSRINGCVYCCSVHAQRFEQMAKRADTVAQVFDNPYTAGADDREEAIVQFAIRITESPDSVGPQDMLALRQAGLDDGEILDLLNATSIFAWANRLMMNLGEAVRRKR